MLSDIDFDLVYTTGENEPVEFFFQALCNSSRFDLGLGFFHSSGFQALAFGFAKFIHLNGTMRIIINDQLEEEDKDAIEKGYLDKVDDLIEKRIIRNFDSLFKTLSKKDEHFFNCLSWLIAANRLDIRAVVPAKGNKGIAHQKYGVFYDDQKNRLSFSGSANFSYKAFKLNVETINCQMSWSDDKSQIKLADYYTKLFNEQWDGESNSVHTIPLKQVMSRIRKNANKISFTEIMEEEKRLIREDNNYLNYKLNKNVSDIREPNYIEYSVEEPKFPFSKGPRQYQIDAYENWVKNNYQGIFAMATGTGKTITSLYCVLEEFKKEKIYNILILVPTRALVSQWIREVKKFNYQNLYSTQDRDWFNLLSNYFLNRQLSEKNNIVFISTYKSFNGVKFQRLLKKDGWNDFILIADEAHNMGASQTIKNLPLIISKRIGLSATPERIYDDFGSQKIYEYFNSFPPCYTYSYSMYKAIHNEPASLVKYYYYPYFTYLSEIELVEYKRITEKLIFNFDSKSGEFNEAGKRLLIKRKRIINKAEGKINVLKQIFKEVHTKEKDLKFTFVYVPEGKEDDYSDTDSYFCDEDDIRLITKYGEVIRNYGYSTHQILSQTTNREQILKQFAENKINVLLAMKILDEGVDVPATKNAIFCANTGNPRQYIQRRGRVLRKAEGKYYANIYDIIVAPKENYINTLQKELKEMEIKIFQNELRRVANFIYAAENKHQVLNGKLGELSLKYNIDLILLIEENLHLDELCN